MDKQEHLGSIGPYLVKAHIATGGMGEIYRAFDPVCEREVAIKQIRQDLRHHEKIRTRFISEAKVASQLTHPTIIPVYSLHSDKELLYYTMPYVEGASLRKHIRDASETSAHDGEHLLLNNLPQLIRIFHTICQGIHYAHTKGFLHRDIKPENVMIGKFGEILILDWGLAESIQHPEEFVLQVEQKDPSLTSPGKVVGTLSYLAPERICGHDATIKSEIYALGILLYQLLTLKLPFKRGSIKEARSTISQEKMANPFEIAPQRELPSQLLKVIKKATAFYPEDRYNSVHDLLEDIERFIDGKPDWVQLCSLSIDRSEDWEFQENILLSKHIAITRYTDFMEWVMLMISKQSFSGNTQLAFRFTPEKGNSGIGILLLVPEPHERKSLEDGICIWLSSDHHAGSTFFLNNVPLQHQSGLCLSEGNSYALLIEKIEGTVKCYIDGVMVFSYTSHAPTIGGHIGLLFRDGYFQLSGIEISSGSQSVMVNCLAIPDAFLISREYDRAIEEYRRIAQSFHGRIESREAIYRSGITLLEKAKRSKNVYERDFLENEAFYEFEKLAKTPAAPLEYLGKSLFYKAKGDIIEEGKSLELGARRFKGHPYMRYIDEQVLFRLYESCQFDRKAAYEFAYLALRNFSKLLRNPYAEEILEKLFKHIETPVYFVTMDQNTTESKEVSDIFLLAFWLNRSFTFIELAMSLPKELSGKISIVQNMWIASKILGFSELREFILEKLAKEDVSYELEWAEQISSLSHWFSLTPQNPSEFQLRYLLFLIEQELLSGKAKEVIPYFEKLESIQLPESLLKELKASYIWTLLMAGEWEHAGRFIRPFMKEAIQNQNSPFFLPYGTFLYISEGKEIALIHFRGALESSFPTSRSLLAHILLDRIKEDGSDPWYKTAFRFEKMLFKKQLYFFYTCIGKTRRAQSHLRDYFAL